MGSPLLPDRANRGDLNAQLGRTIVRPTRATPTADQEGDVRTARVATTVSITLSGLQTVDGVGLAAGDKVLAKDQGGPTVGLYRAQPSAWTSLGQPDAVAILQGTANTRLVFLLTAANTYSANHGVYA